MRELVVARARKRRPAMVGVGTVMLLVIMAGVVLASSYNSTIDYTVQVVGAVRTYDGPNHMNISLTSQQSGPGASTTHRVTLVRRTCFIFCSEDLIGSVQVPRNGASGVRTWTNVGAGNYYFYFTKANDGVRITSNNVHMFSN